MKEINSIARGRKLLAIIAPTSGATDGERENAQALLDRLLENSGITLDDLSTEKRATRIMIVKSKDHATLAAQLLAMILDDWEATVYVAQLTRSKHRVKADLTDAEDRDWRESYTHYEPIFNRAAKAAAAAVKIAKEQQKMTLQGLISAHQIFPTKPGGKTRKLSDEEINALIAARNRARGQSWVRKAGQLDGTLALN